MTIETLYNDWIKIWEEITYNKNNKDKLKNINNSYDNLIKFDNSEKEETDVYIKLDFWFTRKSNLFLPLILLNYDNIYLDINFNKIEDLIYTNYSSTESITNYINFTNINLIYEYYFIDTDEKKF